MKTYIVLSLFFALGCGDDSQGLALDLAVADLATSRDLAVADLSGDPNAILGTFVGACGSVAAQLHVPSPSLIDNALVYVAGEAYVRSSFSTGGQTLFDTPNAGGSSTESELMSEEILHYCDGAHFLKSETEIAYAPPDVDAGGNIITDILVGFGADKVGVSVTRAYKPGGMSDQEVRDLIAKKLDGINHSSARLACRQMGQTDLTRLRRQPGRFGRRRPGMANARRTDAGRHHRARDAHHWRRLHLLQSRPAPRL